VPANAGKRRPLTLRREQVLEGAVGNDGEREPVGQRERRHVCLVQSHPLADRRRTLGAMAGGPLQHGGGKIDANHPPTRIRQMPRDAAGTDGELENRIAKPPGAGLVEGGIARRGNARGRSQQVIGRGPSSSA
jgi:hypothetical protein